jgi:phosphoglycolate phosphatase-like HAD superfamily hydrolase
VKLAVFDIDGTLTDTNDVDSVCYVQALADAQAFKGLNTNWGEYPHTTDSGITLHIFEQRLQRAPDDFELARLKECFVGLLNQHYLESSQLFQEIQGARVALERLRLERDWSIAIATGCWRASAALKLRAAGLELEGIPAAFAEDGLSRESIIEAAISKALTCYGQSNFEKIVSVGDGLWDVSAAHNLKLAFLGVGSGEREARLRRAGAKHVIPDFTNYTQLVQYLFEAETPQLSPVPA